MKIPGRGSMFGPNPGISRDISGARFEKTRKIEKMMNLGADGGFARGFLNVMAPGPPKAGTYGPLAHGPWALGQEPRVCVQLLVKVLGHHIGSLGPYVLTSFLVSEQGPLALVKLPVQSKSTEQLRVSRSKLLSTTSCKRRVQRGTSVLSETKHMSSDPAHEV